VPASLAGNRVPNGLRILCLRTTGTYRFRGMKCTVRRDLFHFLCTGRSFRSSEGRILSNFLGLATNSDC
jgi:hypothetical protein